MTRLLLLMAKCDALAPLVGVSRVWRGVARGAASAARAARPSVRPSEYMHRSESYLGKIPKFASWGCW